MNKKFYLTTAIPYVNGKPHIGHSFEYFIADTIRRYHQLLGEETLLLSGADENALTNVQAAEKEGTPVQEFLDRNSQVFKDTYETLGVHLDVFQRGSDQQKHWPGVQKLWRLCYQNGDIYKKSYQGLYCVGCESFKAPNELVDGICPNHQKKPEIVNEENYFFKLSKYQKLLLQIIESGEFRISPANKKAEIVSFIKSGLQDFSISRSKERARGVGVPVPGDPNQVIYVWFDALDIYMTGIGFGWDENLWKKWWPADLHIIGKDINRFHTVYWPAILLSANLPLPKHVFIHSFINVNGLKISKSIGNVIDPRDVADEFGLEAIRYFLLSQIPTAEDGDFNNQRFKEVYNADLANGLGNLIARVATLAARDNIQYSVSNIQYQKNKLLDEFRFNEALAEIWDWITVVDKQIEEAKPWKLTGEPLHQALQPWVNEIVKIATVLQPFLPETAQKILDQFTGPQISSAPPLFPRIK